MPTLSQRLATLQAERGRRVANYEALLQPSLDEGRELNDVEVTALDAERGEIEGLERQIEHFSQAEALLMRQVSPARYELAPPAFAGAGSRELAPIPVSYPGDRPGSAVVLRTNRDHPNVSMRRNGDYKGAGFTRMAIAVSVAGHFNAAEYARQRWGDDELADTIQQAMWFARAVTPPMGADGPNGAGGGAALVRLEHLGGEFIELLRPMLIVARLPNMRRLQFDGAGTLLIPRQTGGVAGGYVGEGSSIWVQRLTFGQMQLVPSKLAVIVPTTNELLHRGDPGVEQLIRDDMVEGTARTIDRVFFSQAPGLPTAGVAGPPGILLGRPETPNAGFDDFTAHPIGTPLVSWITEALKQMILGLRMADIPMTAPVWIMNARTKEFLRLLRTTQEIFAFKAEIDAGTLLGYPIIDSTNVPINGAANSPWPGAIGTTAYALIDASQLIWAEDMLPMIDASEHASIQALTADQPQPPTTSPAPGAPASPPALGGANPGLWSAFQNDMVFMRIRMRHTWNRRHDAAVAWSTLGPAHAPPAVPGP
jgi:HK97 family phage major capsid protein